FYRRRQAVGSRPARAIELRRIRHAQLCHHGRHLVRICLTAVGLLTAAAFALLSEPLRAQAQRPRSVSSLDISATAVTYADSIHANGVAITPNVRFDWTRATVGASATFSPLSNGGSSVQASLAPSVFTPSAGIFAGEFAGEFGGSTHNDGSRTGQMLGVA